MKTLSSKKGFTIVELVIVIAVIAILAAVLIPTFNSVIGKANESAAMQEAKAALQVLSSEKAKDSDFNDTTYYFSVLNKEGGTIKYAYKYKGSDSKGLVSFSEDDSEFKFTVANYDKVTDLSTEAQKDISKKVTIYTEKAAE